MYKNVDTFLVWFTSVEVDDIVFVKLLCIVIQIV